MNTLYLSHHTSLLSTLVIENCSLLVQEQAGRTTGQYTEYKLGAGREEGGQDRQLEGAVESLLRQSAVREESLRAQKVESSKLQSFFIFLKLILFLIKVCVCVVYIWVCACECSI